MKPITGQYECVHKSGIGLDYFTSRIDRLVLNPNGRFLLVVQQQSRAVNAAKSAISGQQVSTAAPETRVEGSYAVSGNNLSLQFDHGGLEEGQFAANGEGVQLGPNFFDKVSDSTMLPPTHRMKQDMEDIAKGIKIATTLGGFAVKAAKSIQGAMHSDRETEQPTQSSTSQSATSPNVVQPGQPPAYTPPPAQPPIYNSPPPTQANVAEAQGRAEVLFCDQCGARSRPGKRFCNNCGAPLT